jgi:RimJ/RimL family protein N-acetyltransferase
MTHDLTPCGLPDAPPAAGDDPTTPVRVTLHRATPADAEIVFAWRSEPSAAYYQPLRSLSLAEVRRQLEALAAPALDPRLDQTVRWIVEAEGDPVGWLTLEVESREHAIGSVGYTIGERFRGRGYATAAVRALLPLAFSPAAADLARLQAVAAVDNFASRRVLERAGFRCEGIARAYLIIAGRRVDHARYALLRDDWRVESAAAGG